MNNHRNYRCDYTKEQATSSPEMLVVPDTHHQMHQIMKADLKSIQQKVGNGGPSPPGTQEGKKGIWNYD